MDAQFAYVRQEMVAAQPPPPASAGLVGWMPCVPPWGGVALQSRQT